MEPNKKDKIIFLGNMNNMPFIAAKELKDMGYDVTFYVHSSPSYTLDRPECFDSSISYPYPSWIVEMPSDENLNITKLPYLPFIKDKYLKLIENADKVILNGDWVSLGGYIKQRNKKLIVLLAGDDLDVKADYKNINKFALYAALKFKVLFIIYPIVLLIATFVIFQQRRGIRRANGVNYFSTGIVPRADQVLQQIMIGKSYDRLELRGFSFKEAQFVPIKRKQQFYILNFTRFSFEDLNSPANKRNDIMIEGIAKFIKENKIDRSEIKVVFFEKGEDVKAAKELIKKLNIIEFIEWHKPVSQMELTPFIIDSDVVFDQLGNQWIGYGIFAMAFGRPLIANGRPEIFEKLTQEIAPVCQATNADEVAAHLRFLYENPSKKDEIGLKSRNYIIKHYDIRKTAEFLAK